MKHGGGSVMVWSCFASAGPAWLVITNGTMNSAQKNQKILKENSYQSVCDLKFKLSLCIRLMIRSIEESASEQLKDTK